MINKVWPSAEDALSDVSDGSSLMISGFGEVGVPLELVGVLLDLGPRELCIIANNAGSEDRGIAALFRAGRVRKIICSYPRSTGSVWFEAAYLRGDVELEVVPQGTLTERIRAGGAGIAAIYTPAGVGTAIALGKESRYFNEREYLLETALRADFALIKADIGDRWGNLRYRSAARNYGPTMAMAGTVSIAQVDKIVELGDLDPETIVTPGVFIDRVVQSKR